LPRAFVVNRAETLADSGAILIRLADPSFDPFTAVLLEDASELPPGAGDVRYSLRFATYSPTRIEMDTESDKAGYLVLNETYYQGWHAFVDGQETQVYRANYEFKAIALPAGSHRVTFAFSPRSFQVGSMATFATLGGTVAFLWWRRVRREH